MQSGFDSKIKKYSDMPEKIGITKPVIPVVIG